MNLHDRIQAAEHSLAAALRDLDAHQVATLFTADALLTPSGAPPLRGRAQIDGFFERTFQMGIADAKFDTLAVEGDEHQARELGSYKLFAQAPERVSVLVEQGHYMAFWKYEEDRWLLHWSIFNSDS